MEKLPLLTRALIFYGCKMPNHPRKWWLHAKLRNFLKCDINEDIEVVRGGLRWLLNPADFQHKDLFWLGTCDYWDVYHAQQLVQPGSVILDVGANFGYYGIVIANYLHKQCQVHAFEPNTPVFARLGRNIAFNGFDEIVRAHSVGLSDVTGSVNMIHRSDNSGASRLGHGQGDIPITTLDQFCHDQELTRLDFIKIDVEGFEPKVLLGGAESLARFRPSLCVEFWPHGLAQEGATCEDIAELLRGMGYRLMIAQKETLKPLERLPSGDDDPLNVFAVYPNG